MKEENKYIKILLWAYEKGEKGFKWEDLKNHFNLSYGEDQWVRQMFRSDKFDNENLICHLNYNETKDEHLFAITAKGVSATIEYQNLKEAVASGKRAEKVAMWSILIGIIVGIVQIYIGFLQLNSLNLPTFN